MDINLSVIKKLLIIFLFGLVSGTVYTQSRFGIEVSSAWLETRNAGKLMGADIYYKVDAERDTINSSYKLGFYYKLTENHIFQLSLGRHHNARILDITTFDDTGPGGGEHFTDIYALNQYFQINPSYAFRIRVKKLCIPLEVGLNINRRINIEDTKYVGTRIMNYDLSLSSGVGYVVTNYLSAAISVVYNHALNEYQTMYEYGTFKPRQVGFEISMMYQLPGKTKE